MHAWEIEGDRMEKERRVEVRGRLAWGSLLRDDAPLYLLVVVVVATAAGAEDDAFTRRRFGAVALTLG
jgi:hypothetical protein